MKDNIVLLPEDSPKIGEVYQHYKGDLYEVIALALHSNDEEWMVVYKPLYEIPDAPLFTRPLREWSEDVKLQTDSHTKTLRFTKI